MKKAEQLVRQGEHYILDLAATYRKCWEAARRYDGLNSHCVFAIFSDANPYTPYLERLCQQYQEAVAAFEVWGYVGQRISSRS